MIMRVVVGSGHIALAMEADSCFPCELLKRCHRGVPSSRLTGPMINDDRVRSCSSIRRQLRSASPSPADSVDRGGWGGRQRERALGLPASHRASQEQNINLGSMTTTSVFNIRTQYRALVFQQRPQC